MENGRLPVPPASIFIRSRTLIIGLILSTMVMIEWVYDVSGTNQISNTQTIIYQKNKNRNKQEMSDFHLCQSEHVSQNNSTLKLMYQCDGKSYERFADKLYQLVRQMDGNNTNWGKRDYPVPAGTTVLLLGNSHLRQVSKTVSCAYGHVIDSIHSQSEDIFTVKFTNNATWITVTNTVLVHSHNWPALIEEYFLKDQKISFDSLDAIVLGKFTSYQEARNTNYETIMAAEEDFYANTLGQPVNFTSIAPPTLVSLARLYSRHILAVTMFASSDMPRAQKHLEAFQKEFPGRSNVVPIHFRKYIERLGLECGSDDKYTLGTCHEPGDKNLKSTRSPADMHRCAGALGGHADLVAWDVVEELHHAIK
jgi:hypothetical protein